MDLKKPLTFDEQLDKLIAHGMVISDREKAKDILKKVNYYRFTGYALQFRKDPSGSYYIEGTTFETVYHLYRVDEILRDTFRRYIEKAEVYYRTQEMVETIFGDEYFVTEESKSVQEVATSQEPDYMELLVEFQSRFICLQYEFQYNLDKISDLDYEHRYRNPEYITYQSNVSRIMDKSSYINQWTAELAKLGLFQKDLKKMYKEQIETATIEVKRIEKENERILNKAGCRSQSEFYARQQVYDKNWSLCNTLAERNQSIRKECEVIIQEYAQLVEGVGAVLNNEGFGNNNQVEHIAEQKSKAVLQEMYGKDFSEYGFRDVCIKAEMQLQNSDKDRSYERGIRIR